MLLIKTPFIKGRLVKQILIAVFNYSMTDELYFLVVTVPTVTYLWICSFDTYPQEVNTTVGTTQEPSFDTYVS
ncbi:MAG: hypothetical protein KJ666_10730 [Bacteroidetes bacterium]|nr:hypothetical protein [Bacteroidota bacterium]